MEMKATRKAYAEALIELGKQNPRVVVLDADLAHATFTMLFRDVFPERHYNMGIAEANMVDVAAGMSTTGLVPFCSTFAVFGTGRVYEQIRNSVAYPNFNVKLAMTHAGISVGEDGGSHQSIEDVALMRVIPNMTIICPADANETRDAVFAAAKHDGPVYLRLARAETPVLEGELQKPFQIGKANVLREGNDVAIFTYGIMVNESLKAADILAQKGVSAAVINMHTIKPLDKECVLKYACACHYVVTAEEHSIIGGLGEAVAATLLEGGAFAKFKRIGVKDCFGQSGKPDELMFEYGLSASAIAEEILN